MKTDLRIGSQHAVIVCLFTIGVAVSSCGPGQLLGPTHTPTPTIAPTPTPTPIRSRGDLHMHTTCSDGVNTYEEMVQASLNEGFDFIAITDHRFDGRGGPCGGEGGVCDDTLCASVIEKCRQETRLLCIPGMEITGRVHMVALGIHAGIDESLSVKDWVEEIHKQGGFAIAAHPYSFSPHYTDEEMFESGLDARECQDDGGSSRLVNGEWVRIDIPEIPCVYGRDAHSTDQLGTRFGECDADIKTYDDLIAAILAFKCHNPIW